LVVTESENIYRKIIYLKYAFWCSEKGRERRKGERKVSEGERGDAEYELKGDKREEERERETKRDRGRK